jgi:hypothetical protein
MSQDVPDIFEMPLTFATADFEEFVRELKPHLVQIQAEEESERQTRVDKMCVFYAKLLAEMAGAVRTIRIMYSDKLCYKYDMRACRTAHGKLKDSEEYKLAYEIFTYFNAEHLLHIAKLPSVESDNSSVIFHREEHVLGYQFRPTLPNVFDWFENLGLRRW